MDAPIITSLTDSLTGSEVTIALTNPVEAVSLIVLYKDAQTAAWTSSAQALAASIGFTVPTAGKIYEIIVVAVDVSGNYSLPSNVMRAAGTTGDGPLSRRIEKNIMAELATITTVNGYFDTVDNVYRISYVPDVEAEAGLFMLVGFDSVEHNESAQRGNDILDMQSFNFWVGACKKGRDGTTDWIPDSLHEMLAAVQTAIMTDKSRSGLAINTECLGDSLRAETLKGCADAVAIKQFTVTFRTTTTDPEYNGVC